MSISYLDFELEIGPGDGRTYPLAVIRSPAGNVRSHFDFALGQLELRNYLLELQNALLRSGGRRRKALSQEEQTVRDFGKELFSTLFQDDVRSLFYQSKALANQDGKLLRLKLRILDPKMASLPWEYLFDPRQTEYLCLSHSTPLVRYLEVPQPPHPLTVEPPLRILGMIASPDDQPSLNVQTEKERLQNALAHLIDEGLVELVWLEGETWRHLLRAMRPGQGPWHAFHFVGHGAFDHNRDEGVLAFANPDGRSDFRSATDVARLLSGQISLRLVLLNACEGAHASETDIFASTAATLVQRGIPAVIAMQYEITDAAAIEFSTQFYDALTDGLPVDAAVTDARRAVSLAINNTLEWGIPVLFMRSNDGMIFEFGEEGIRYEGLGIPRESDEGGIQDSSVEAAAGYQEQNRRSEATQKEPEQSESAQPEPVQPEPEQPEPTQPEPEQPEPTQPEPEQPDEEEIKRKEEIRALTATLKNLHKPELLGQSPHANLKPVRRLMADNPTLTVDQAVVDFLTRTLKLLANEDQLLADLLRGLYWEQLTMKRMAELDRPKQMSNNNLRRHRDRALEAFVELIDALDQETIALPPQVKEQIVKPPQKKALPEFEWVPIPAGPFWVGSLKPPEQESQGLWDRLLGSQPPSVATQNSQGRPYDSRARDNELPQHQVTLDAFRMAKYPVTNAQYKLFVDAENYRAPNHWENGKIPTKKDDHPVVNVSWHDAVAFCKWAGVYLPSEAQWEKAARGDDGRIYPWGNEPPTAELCNFWGAGIGDTTTVGNYPKGVSPYGCLDMAGNVWEMTSSLYKPYPHDPTDGRENQEDGRRRTWRGGAFGSNGNVVRCAYRLYWCPVSRHVRAGFRVMSPGAVGR